MKRFNYGYIVLIVVLGFFNIKYFDSKELSIFCIIQLIYILYLSLIRKDLKNALVYQIIFILSSSAFPQNLELIEEGFKMNTYSKIKLIGPISYSYVGLISIFIMSFFYKKKMKIFKFNRYDQFLYTTLIITLIGISLGISGIFLDQYNISKFISRTIYNVNFIAYLYLLKKLFDTDKEKIIKLLTSLLIASPIITIFLNMVGYIGRYGGVNKYPTIDIFEYSNVLLLTILFEKIYVLEVIMGIISIILGKSIYGGKGVISVIFILIIFCIKSISNLNSKELYLRRRSRIIIVIQIILIIFLVNYILKNLMEPNKELLITYKIQQVLDLFKIVDLSNINTISHSPRVRIASILNTAYHYYLNPIFLLLGVGFGGYFRDYLKIFPNLKFHDFSEFEIKNNIFFSAHDSLPSIFLTNGLLGIIYIFFWGYIFLRKVLKNQWAVISVMWILLVMSFNHHFSILAALAIFLCLNENE